MAATQETRRILVFTEGSDVDATRRAKVLVTQLQAAGHVVQHCDKLSADVEQLLLVAKYRVLATPMWLVADGPQIVLRLQGVPSPRQALSYLEVLP